MIFVRRAAIVSLVTFASALLGFGLQSRLPASYVAESKGMALSTVGLDATLLALVLGLLIWTTTCLPLNKRSCRRSAVR